MHAERHLLYFPSVRVDGAGILHNEASGTLRPQLIGGQRQIVVVDLAPLLAGIVIVIVGASFVLMPT